MLSLTDPEDHALLITDMTQQRNDLKREQHMRQIKKLAQRQCGLRVMTIQKQVIKALIEQLKNVRTDVSNVYSPNNALKDNESKGYLLYLLEMSDYYGKQTEKLREQLKEKENSVKDTYFKICSKQREYARMIRRKIRHIPKTKIVDMYESRIERASYEIGRMTTKNRKFRENIQHMFIVRANYFKVYQQLVQRNREDKGRIDAYLEGTVTAYRNREDLVYKTSVLSERLLADIQKTKANSVLLHRIKEREEKADEFEAFKAKERPDCRASQLEELVRKGVTGLEPEVQAAKVMHASIMEASGSDSIEELKESFQTVEKENFNYFYYISSLHEEIDSFRIQLSQLRNSIDKSEKSLTQDQRRCRREIAKQKTEAERLAEELVESERARDSSVAELRDALQALNKAVSPTLPDVKEELENEDYVWEVLAVFESKIAELLMAMEYVNYLDVGQEDESAKRTEVEADLEEEDLEMAKPSPGDQALADRVPPPLTEVMSPTLGRRMETSDLFLDRSVLRDAALETIKESDADYPGPSSSQAGQQ